MVRYTEARVQPFYEAASRFVSEALKSDGSLFTPGVPVWSADSIEDLYHRFVEQPDTGPDRFDVKLQQQLHGAPAIVIQLAAEVLFVHLLIVHPSKMGAAAKRNSINSVLSWGAGEVTIPPDLDMALGAGTASPGTAFQTRRDNQISVLLEVARKWKAMTASQREEALADPWKFKALVESMGVKMSTPQIRVLFYMVFPDYFEDIVSLDQRQQIVQHFASLVDAPSKDVDRQLVAIREALSPQFGAGFAFWDPQVKALWSPTNNPWDAFIKWGWKFYEDEGFEQDERQYKLDVVAKLQVARDALLAGQDDWLNLLKSAFQNPKNNLTNWQGHDKFLKWCATKPDDAEVMLRKLWSGDASTVEKVALFAKLDFVQLHIWPHTQA